MDLRTILLLFLGLGYPTVQSNDNDQSSSTTVLPRISVGDDIANALNDFGYKLTLEMMKQNVNKNIILAPPGVAGLLAMTLLGSVGATYDELVGILGFSQDILTNRKNHEQFGQLLRTLKVNDTMSKTTYANAIFLEQQTQLREVFRDYLKTVYNADAQHADFKNTSKAREMINDWVNVHTAGNIQDFLKKPLSQETKLVLLNALYFSGQWKYPFVPEYTRKMAFNTSVREVMVDLMLNFGEFQYVFSPEDDLHIVALPYNDSTTTMYALKPQFPHRTSLPELMERLNYAKIDSLIAKMKNSKVVIRFPKMELMSDGDLRTSLEALGVNSMFNAREANFALMIDGNKEKNENQTELITRINNGDIEERTLKDRLNDLPNPGVFVSSILHQVKITINEFGTQAVAATGGFLARSAEQFYADSPFYIFIRNEKTKLVTFSAVIFNPLE